MKPALSALGAGALFGAGLGVAGMTQPSKITSFLDVTGEWDPSLALVMVGAIAVHSILFRIVRRRATPLFDVRFHVPTRRDFDANLFIGAAVFGLGWGLSGLCPGPALVNLGGASSSALVFVAAMTVGILLGRAAQTAQAKPNTGSTGQGGGAAPQAKAQDKGSAVAEGGSL